MKELSPIASSQIAKHVYTVQNESSLQTAAELAGGLGIQGQFEIQGGQRFQGNSGALIFKKKRGCRGHTGCRGQVLCFAY